MQLTQPLIEHRHQSAPPAPAIGATTGKKYSLRDEDGISVTGYRSDGRH
jgi:hypothetical protein